MMYGQLAGLVTASTQIYSLTHKASLKNYRMTTTRLHLTFTHHKVSVGMKIATKKCAKKWDRTQKQKNLFSLILQTKNLLSIISRCFITLWKKWVLISGGLTGNKVHAQKSKVLIHSGHLTIITSLIMQKITTVL